MDNVMKQPAYEHQNEEKFQIHPVGYLNRQNNRIFIEILHPYRDALKGLDQFSHVQVIWWFNHFDDEDSRKTNTFDKMPFEAPELGVFACRSPMRPNPLGLTTAKIVHIDHVKGLIEVPDFDAYDGTPILDLKAYLPSCDRVHHVSVANWAANWAEWLPENGLGLEGKTK
jgi:tRNA (adenine37-N6)-methyltransferase